MEWFLFYGSNYAKHFPCICLFITHNNWLMSDYHYLHFTEEYLKLREVKKIALGHTAHQPMTLK